MTLLLSSYPQIRRTLGIAPLESLQLRISLVASYIEIGPLFRTSKSDRVSVHRNRTAFPYIEITFAKLSHVLSQPLDAQT